MNEAFDFPDLNELLDNLNETNTEILNESLQKLIQYCQPSYKDHLSSTFPQLFDKLPTLLLDENLSIIVHASQFLIELVTQFPNEVEKHFETVLESLVVNLADSKVDFKKINHLF